MKGYYKYASGGKVRKTSVKHQGANAYKIGQEVLYKRKMFDGTPQTRWVYVDEKNGKKGISWYVSGAGSMSDNSFFIVPDWKNEIIPADKVTKQDLSFITYGYANGGNLKKANVVKNHGYRVFNYTDNIYASPNIYKSKKQAQNYVTEFRNRYNKQGYYRTNTMGKISPEEIELEIIPANFNPFNGNYEDEAITYAHGGLTPDKARKILRDGTVHGKPITDKQRRYFGAVASGYIKADGGISLESIFSNISNWLNSPL